MIVEDELLAQQVMQSHINKTKELQLVATCRTAVEASRLLLQHSVDVLFLDIQLPGMTGLEMLKTLEDPPLVVFTTAYSTYAVESYELNIIDYLLKPISYERFSKAVAKIQEAMANDKLANRNSPESHMYVKCNSEFHKVYFSDIIYIESRRDYLQIHTIHNNLFTLQTLNEMEKVLPEGKFFRIHRSYIVSVAHIKKISGKNVDLESISLPMGKKYRDQVMELVS